MPIRALLRYLLNNEQLIQKLADSYPIRRAAQFGAYVAHKGKQIGEEGFENLVKSDPVKKIQDEASNTSRKIKLFKDTFVQEIKEGTKEIKGKDKDR